MERKIFVPELADELNLAQTTIKARLKKIDSFRYYLGRRYCLPDEAEKVKNYRETYRQGLKQK